MPELPEVETVTQSVKKHLLGNNFDSIQVNWKKTLHNFKISDFNNKIKGRNIENVYRKGKYIVIVFKSVFLCVHLRMTGKLYAANSIEKDKKHISLFLTIGDKYLVFEDVRKFGRFYMFDNLDFLDNKLGIEPLSEGFSENWILNQIKERKRQMKSLLLDQSFICGIGNIYADEALWYAKIHPLSNSSSISKKKILNLRKGIIKVLKESIKRGGTTIRDYTYDFSYVGNYALKLNVFGKEGKKCPRCFSVIIKTKVAQRGTHYCPRCQIKR
ncbi:MAG: DNA-formamidopyrimidine glycosylase [Candidatus Marinimicrobia bacterium]|nr:DNA-formamidopyrimidine glycosylase [Candidatus Neomarinimicrobiota bacterium]|tara:strand:- start:2194 stop:3006 length:813 start_codon:yes stop_codon:yes gene_type:complete